MRTPEFEQVREKFNALASSILNAKATYGQEDVSGDRLDNFKQVAAEYGLSALQVCGVYMEKHNRALQNWIRERSNQDGPITTIGGEAVEMRLADLRNYVDLLYALYVEDKAGEELKQVEAT